jgi:hypothetical protein
MGLSEKILTVYKINGNESVKNFNLNNPAER